MWAGMAPSRADGAAGEPGPVAWLTGSETSGPVDCRGGWEMVVLGAKQGFLKEVEMGEGGSVM